MPVFRSTLPLSPREAARSRNWAVFFCGRYVGRIWAKNAKTSLKAGSTQSNPFCPKRKNRKGSFLLCRIISLCLTRNRHSVHIYDGIKANPNSSNKANPIPATKPPDRVALLVEQAVHIDDVYPLRTCTPERAKKKQALDLQGLASGGLIEFISEPFTPFSIACCKSEKVIVFEPSIETFYLTEIEDFIKREYDNRLNVLRIPYKIDMRSRVMINSDKNGIFRILSQLLENAVKYTDGRGITVIVDKTEDGYCFSVRDTGSRIPDSEMPYVFNSFWRGSNAEGVEGNGLGLYEAAFIVRKLGGDIAVRYIEEAEEMEFEVFLPL